MSDQEPGPDETPDETPDEPDEEFEPMPDRAEDPVGGQTDVSTPPPVTPEPTA